MQRGSKGRDVVALHRALRKAGFRSGKATNTFDEQTEREVSQFQKANPPLEVDGVVGPNTFRALLPHYDGYARWLVAAVAKAMKNPTTIRQRIVAAAYTGYANRDNIRYTQSAQRMEGVRKKIRPPDYPRYEDCSSYATWCYYVAGAPDPNGLGYNGQGYTGTQIGHGKETSNPRPGDLVFYGPSHSSINHVTLYVGNGRVISHGQESGPSLYPIDYDRGSRGGRQQIRTYL